MSVATLSVKEGKEIVHPLTFSDLNFFGDYVFDWDITSSNFTGTAMEGVDFTFSHSKSQNALSLAFKANRDTKPEPTENATLNFSGWVDAVLPGESGNVYTTSTGLQVEGWIVREDISDSISFQIIDGSCVDRSALKAVKMKIGELKESRAAFNLLSQEIDTIKDGVGISREADKTLDVAKSVFNRTLNEISPKDLQALAKEFRHLERQWEQLRDEEDIGVNFSDMRDATSAVKNSTERLIDAAKDLGYEISDDPFKRRDLNNELADQAEMTWNIISTDPNTPITRIGLFSALIDLLQERNKKIQETMIEATIENQLDELKGEINTAAKELGLKPRKFELDDLIKKIDRKFDKKLDELKVEKTEIKKCNQEKTPDTSDTFIFNSTTLLAEANEPLSLSGTSKDTLPISSSCYKKFDTTLPYGEMDEFLDAPDYLF
ncbi:hypothetical protein K3722_07560 [Leisingera caerulea]|uniref:Uncharacterized protein n=1 Tax=Leisingera caerulea TaxID=506591 RepID=A0ABY5X0V4_LEICA|nr:hypothetical protein [Leisingera caerulea]UWQ59978.1 hypothetical protein K3722_07560 [Leisingera caerulea]